MRGNRWISLGAALMALAVAAGAVGTHVLKEQWHLEESALVTYDVAVRFHLLHALGMIVVGLLMGRSASKWLSAAEWMMLVGIVLFSGGLYGYILAKLPLVHVVPVGGLSWIAGWVCVAIGAARQAADI